MTIETRDKQLLDQAREMSRGILSRSVAFNSAPLAAQKSMYLDSVKENYDKLLSQSQNFARGMVEDFEDYNPGFENSVDAFEDLVDSVDFPQFVGDLLKSVFDANLRVMKEQTDNYIKLLREATKTSADFIKSIREEDALAYLVDTKSNQFGMTMEQGADGSMKMELTTPEGEPVDMEDNEVKAKIVDAKVAMAKEHRAALREVILMGVTRLVVDKGEIEAGVEFRITANRNSQKANTNTNTNVTSMDMNYSQPLGGIFGGPSGSFSMTNTNINVATSSQAAEDELFAKLMGKVNIKFKTDYFKLDNFANMYADGGIAALQPNQQQGQLPATG